MLVARLAVALPLLAAALSMILWGPAWLWESITFIAALLAAYEWAKLGDLPRNSAFAYTGLAGVFMLIGQYMLDTRLEAGDVFFGVICFFWAFIAPLFILTNYRMPRMIYCAVGMMIIFSTWYAATSLFLNFLYVLLAIMAVVWTADSAAYIVGKRWGKTKMSPQVSPGKTWEGFFGGMSASLALAYFFGNSLFFAPSTVWLLMATASVVLLAVLGDLFESSLKRHSGVKDSGFLLGSHGGILDRFDALLPTLPFGMLIASWLS